jgi:Septum formation
MRSARSGTSSAGCGVLAVIAFSLLLTSCSGGASAPPSKPGVTQPAATKPAVEKLPLPPKVGDCWNTSPGLLVGLTWQGLAAVPCGQQHNAVTYRVGTLPAGLSYATVEADRLTKTSVVTDSCNDAAAHTYLGRGNFHPPLRVDDVFFAPSRRQWAAGARWFRCDLGFPDILSDPDQRLDWQPLPADLGAAIHTDDRPFGICSSGSAKGPPGRLDATIGKCAAGLHWIALRSVDIAKKRGDRFPDYKVLLRRGLAACRGEAWVSWPTVRDWNDGKTRVLCWEKWTGR